MPKWVYDPRTNSMIPQTHTNDIDFQMLRMGFQVDDHKNNIRFVITPEDDIIFTDKGIHQFIYTDYRRAAMVAQRIHRVYPNSKFGTPEGLLSWRRTSHIGESISSDDKALLRSIYESYEPEDIEKYIESINEGHIASVPFAASSHGQTPGTTEHGLKGALNALPSFILSFLVCPPAAMIGLIGAVHERAEKRWLKTRINPGRWKDFIATPNEKKEQIKKKIEEEMARNNSYYIAELANGEIIRVVGSTTLEAREIVEKLEQEKYFKLNSNLSAEARKTGNKVWKVTFDDNEVTYIVGPENARQQLLAAAQKDKELEVEAYKKIYKEVVGKKLDGTGKEMIDDILVPIKVPKADDIVILDTGYSGINESNYKKYKLYKADSASAWSPSYKKYVVSVGDIKGTPVFTFNIAASSEQDLITILDIMKMNDSVKRALRDIDAKFTNIQDPSWIFYKVAMSNGDILVIPGDSSQTNMDGESDEITSQSIKRLFAELGSLANPIEECLFNIVRDPKISKETLTYYTRYITGGRGAATASRPIGTIKNEEGTSIVACVYGNKGFRYENIFNTSEFKAVEVDTKTDEETPIIIKLSTKEVVRDAA